MTIKELVLHHLQYTFEKEAWQPSLAMAVKGLTVAQAAWKPGPNRHSVWQVVRHVTHWKRATLGAWDGSRPLFRASWDRRTMPMRSNGLTGRRSPGMNPRGGATIEPCTKSPA